MRQNRRYQPANQPTSPAASALSRRNFLSLIGATTAAAALSACSTENSDPETSTALPSNALPLTEEETKLAKRGGAILPGDTPEVSQAHLISISILMGLGIAIDVAVATLAMYRKLGSTKSKAAWIGGVGLSHILLPVASGAATAGVEKGGGKLGIGDMTQRTLSAGSFAILAKFLYGEIRGEEEGEDEEDVDVLGALDQSVFKYLGAVWAVSVDAAISGPAKWEQARNEGWTQTQIAESVVIAGLTVSFVAAMALKGAEMLHSKYGTQGSEEVDNSMGRLEDPALFVECLALNYFGMQAITNGSFKLDLNFTQNAGLGAAFTAALFTWAKSKRPQEEAFSPDAELEPAVIPKKGTLD